MTALSIYVSSTDIIRVLLGSWKLDLNLSRFPWDSCCKLQTVRAAAVLTRIQSCMRVPSPVYSDENAVRSSLATYIRLWWVSIRVLISFCPSQHLGSIYLTHRHPPNLQALKSVHEDHHVASCKPLKGAWIRSWCNCCFWRTRNAWEMLEW